MSKTNFDSYGRYIIKNYLQKKPFVNFLPGISGLKGIPMWVFYVNRGQGITSFGVESKDAAIMEFEPANKAYRHTSHFGFTTYIKFENEGKTILYEAFSGKSRYGTSTNMYIGQDNFEIEEICMELGFQINVQYFTIPNESFAALSRQVTIKNISKEDKKFEFLDGMPIIVPAGINNNLLKEMGRTVEAWIEVNNLENDAPYFKIRASLEDSAKIERPKAGNFGLSHLKQDVKTKTLKAIVDPKIIFGHDLSFTSPLKFIQNPIKELQRLDQKTFGQMPCVFFGDLVELAPGETIQISSLFGNLEQKGQLDKISKKFSKDYLDHKQIENTSITQNLNKSIYTKTGNENFDAYTSQTYLDNCLRGGIPITLGEDKTFHVFSRKHGDPERDYNFFYLSPEYYSQGNAAYRDVNQNRRNDVLFYPEIGDYNLRFFLSLIQFDGYNPLIVKGTTYKLNDENKEKVFSDFNESEVFIDFFSKSFTPGSLQTLIGQHTKELFISGDRFFDIVIQNSSPQIEADFGEGYWVDHWTYNLDLLESYLSIFPDNYERVIFEPRNIPWFQSSAKVNPRHLRYQHTENGLRQYNGISFDIESEQAVEKWIHKNNSPNDIYYSSIFEKLFILLMIKASTLDQFGMGVEMEAGKPGWYDALNGLPGLFGSSVSETYEILRLIKLLKSLISPDELRTIAIPVEVSDFIEKAKVIFSDDEDEHLKNWQGFSSLRESYREKIYQGISGKERELNLFDVSELLNILGKYFEKQLSRINHDDSNIPPTYYYYKATRFLADEEPIDIASLKFEQKNLPHFLEGSVHALRLATPKQAQKIYYAIKNSDLFDKKLGMYKVNASLEGLSIEIGRAAAFPPGWLENESIWLHMEYKYLLEILKKGLYKEFYEDVQTALVPFLHADQYGRSPLENSSFIASSAYPDASVHGTGFVSRLSGATAEFLSLWFEMFIGNNPFEVIENKLVLEFKPKLADWLFPANGIIETTFLGQTKIIYKNSARNNTWEALIESIELIFNNGDNIQIKGSKIQEPYAYQVREGLVETIIIYFGEQSIE
ncbi:MAG: cellobiose phosphorylase [Chloroflexi bacterium]|nr:cellobiose phosphorylase [Chloroflexota bacterium]